MDFSSLVLMEKDKESGFLTKELGSYEVSAGAQYITKMFYDGEYIHVYFDTGKDVDEWEFTAIYDLFSEEILKKNGFTVEEVDNEYNPTWLVKFEFHEEHTVVQNKLKVLCNSIEQAIEKVFEEIAGKENQYS